MTLWIAESTTYFGTNPVGFTSRRKAEEYVERSIPKDSTKEIKKNITIYVESSNGEDVYVLKVNMQRG